MDFTKKLPEILSVCSGYGGIERGIEMAVGECRVVAHVEIEAFAVENLANEMEKGALGPAPIWTDAKTFPAELFQHIPDILVGGYPCQPFSNIGRRLGADDPRHLWPYIRRIMRIARPRLCFFENVEGHINRGLEQVLDDLEAEGYRTTWGLFSAREVGATHWRKRIFILGDNRHRSFAPIWKTVANRRRERLERLSRNVDHSTGPEEFNGPNRPFSESCLLLRWPAAPTSVGGTEVKVDRMLPSTRASDAEGGRIQTEDNKHAFRSYRNNSNQYFGAKLRDVLEMGAPTTKRYNPDWGEQFMGLPVGTTQIDNLPVDKQRKDRIILLGNGVVPPQAALAFTILGDKLFGRISYE